jgi:hypothetical protein
MNKNQLLLQMQSKFVGIFTPRQVYYFAPLGIFFSWRTRNWLTPILLGGKALAGRSEPIQITIVILLAIFYIFLLFSIFYVIRLFVSRYLKESGSKFLCRAIVLKQNTVELPAIIRKERKIAILSLIIYLGFVLAVFYHYVMGADFGYGYPYNTFLFRPGDRWADFTNLFHIWDNPYGIVNFARIAFPFLYKSFSIFALFSPFMALFLFLLIFLSSFIYICLQQLRIGKSISLTNFFVFTFLTYPFLFSLDRANYEIVVFLCLYIYIFSYKKKPLISAVFLGFAIALKAFPVIFSILLLTDRKYKELAIAAIVSISTTLLSYATLPGGISTNIPSHLHNLQLYTQLYAIQNEGMLFGHSLWGGIKFFSILTSLQMISTTNYTIMIFVGLICLVIYIGFVEKFIWKKIALLVCALNLFPQVSADYKLLHIFIPLFLFINDTETDNKWSDWVYLALFGLLLIPKNYYRLPNFPEASISVLLNPLLMLALIVLIMITGLVKFFRNQQLI